MVAIVQRARVTLGAILALLVLAVGAAAPASADTVDRMVQLDTQFGADVKSFIDSYSDQSAPPEALAIVAQKFELSARNTSDAYSRIADSADNGELAGMAKEFSAAAGDMATAAETLKTALPNQDQAAVTEAEGQMQTAFERYTANVDAFNAYAETIPDPSYVGWLIALIVAVVLLVLALLLAVFSRKHIGLLAPKADRKGRVTQASLSKMRWMIVLWAAVFVVGAAIPFLQVVFAEPDASGHYTYRVFWYPLVIGALLTVASAVQYFVAAAKVRNQGSALPYDPANPATHPNAAGAGEYMAVPQDPAVNPAAPGVPLADGAPLPQSVPGPQGAPLPPGAPVSQGAPLPPGAPVPPAAPPAPPTTGPDAPPAGPDAGPDAPPAGPAEPPRP